jgi:hypothetical protein
MEGKAKDKTTAIVKKICAVMKTIGAIPKASKNDHFGYKYRSHEDITNKLQPALEAEGLIIIPVEKRIIASDPGYVLLEVTFEITDGSETITFIGIGEGIDKSKMDKPGDKAAYKAQTGAMKYALNDLLMLAGQDPEADKQTHPDEPTKKQQQNQPANKPAANQSASKKPATTTPQAKPEKYKLTQQEESGLVDVMDAMKYSEELKELGLKKARVEGPKKAKAKLDARYVEYQKKQKAAEAAKGGEAE